VLGCRSRFTEPE